MRESSLVVCVCVDFDVVNGPEISIHEAIEMCTVVQNICRLAHGAFSNLPLKPDLEKNLRKVLTQFSKVTLGDLYLNLNDLAGHNSYAPVSFTSVFENDIFSFTVFGFRRSTSVIPLHDHPGMHGFIKCLHGRLSIKSYNIINGDTYTIPAEIYSKIIPNKRHDIGNDMVLIDNPQFSKSIFVFPHTVASVFVGETITTNDDNEVCSLTPNSRNIHEIRPVGNQMTVMADLITPPYTAHTKYYYYKLIGTTVDSETEQSITWLLRDVDPDSFFCDTIPYLGPRISV